MTDYTHGNTIEQHRMVAYRKYLMDRKRKENVNNVSQGRGVSRRTNRALIHYREYVGLYLQSKREYLGRLNEQRLRVTESNIG